MIGRVIIDAGPAINFLATNNEKLLLSVTGGSLCAPETVADEVHRKARADARFGAAPAVWSRLANARRLQVLSDAATPDLVAVVERLSGYPYEVRSRRARDLGELMVIAHAVPLAESGYDVVVLIDDSEGARLATLEMKRIQRLVWEGSCDGSFTLVNTAGVLTAAAGNRWLPDKSAMRRVYTAIRACDDGLVDINQTRLLHPDTWSR